MKALRLGRWWWGIGWLGLLLASWLMLMPDPPATVSVQYADKVEHVVGFFVLFFWFAQLLVRSRHAALFMALLVYGIVIEVTQGLGGVRQMELADVLADSAGLLLAWAVTAGRAGELLLVVENWLYRGNGRTL